MVPILQLFCILFLVYLGVVCFMYFRQENFLFRPVKRRHDTTQDFDDVTAYTLDVPGASLNGWLVNRKYRRERLLIYYGGNAEDIYYNIDEFEALQMAALFVAYRGYGSSSGKPGEKAFFSDALAVYDDVVQQFSPDKVFLMGRSIGSGVASYVASKRSVSGTILVTPFDSIVSVAQSFYPWLPVKLLLKHRFESTRYVATVTSPFLVLFGGQDSVVSEDHTRRLLDVIKGETTSVYIENADHGNIDMYPAYWHSIISFINEERMGTVETIAD